MQDHFKREILLSIGLMLGASALIAGPLFWLAGAIESRAQEAALSRSLIAGRAKAVETLAALKQNTRDVDRYQALMDQLLPTEEELIDFPKSIDALARINDAGASFSFQGATVKSTGGSPGYSGFSLEVSGGLSQIENFFFQLETRSQRFLVAVDSFDLVKNGETYQVRSNGRVFFR